MPTPRTLLSLNHDVLREILAHLLLDTPRDFNRTSILRTSSLLHELGLPLLYRVVSTEEQTGSRIPLGRWRTLFGVGGVLAKGSRTEVGPFGRELRLGAQQHLLEGHNVPELDLPNCSSLSLPVIVRVDDPVVSRVALQLPLTDLSLCFEWARHGSILTDSYGKRLSDVVGLHPQPLAWRNLERLTFRDILWRDPVGKSHRRLSLSDWSFKVLVFEAEPRSTEGAEKAFALFLEPLQVTNDDGDEDEDENEREGEAFLPNLERIEFRIGGGCAKEIEQKFRKEATRRKGRGLDEVEERLMPMMVFVGEDGKERRLIEE